jgi:hypothetical protein
MLWRRNGHLSKARAIERESIKVSAYHAARPEKGYAMLYHQMAMDRDGYPA